MGDDGRSPGDGQAGPKAVRGRVAIAVLSLLAVGSTASGQPARDVSKLTLDELLNVEVETVYGASKYLQKIAQAPASVSIVTAEEIRIFGYRTLADVMRSVSGFYVTNDRNYSYVGARGFSRPGDYNTRVLLLVDGHVINNNVFDQALLGTEFPVDVDLIDRVEVIRGPGSSLYGTNAFFGVINVVMRTGRELSGFEAAAEIGSLGTRRFRAGYGSHSAAGVDWLVSATSYRSDGQTRLYFSEFDSPRTNHGIADHLDRDASDSVFARLAFGGLTVQAAYGLRDKHVPTAAFDTIFNDPRFRTSDSQGYVDARYDRRVGAGTDVTARLAYDRYHYHGEYPTDRGSAGDPLAVLNADYAAGDWLSGEVKVIRKVFASHQLTVGADLRYSLGQLQRSYDIDPHVVYLDDHRRLSNIGLYVQDDFPLGRHVLISAGVRHDYYQTFGSTANPRGALIYSPTDTTVIKLLAGRAYRAPNAYELYYEDPGSHANPDLKPERIVTYEAVLEQHLGRRIRIAASVFRNDISRLITQQADPTDGALIYQNENNVSARGMQAEFNTHWANGARVTAAFTVQRAMQEPTDDPLTNSPTVLGKLTFLLPLRKGTLSGVEVQYVSARRTLAGRESPAYALTNLTLVDQRLFKPLELTVGVYNLFDQRYGDPGAEEHVPDILWQDGRRVRVGLVYRFGVGR